MIQSVFVNETIENKHYTGQHMNGSMFSHTTFEDCYFTDCMMRVMTMRECSFINCTFTDCNIDRLFAIRCDFHGSKFNSSCMFKSLVVDAKGKINVNGTEIDLRGRESTSGFLEVK